MEPVRLMKGKKKDEEYNGFLLAETVRLITCCRRHILVTFKIAVFYLLD